MVTDVATHLYTVVQGSYRSSLLTGETWQFGVRWGLKPGLPIMDPIGDFNDFTVVPQNVSRTETSWTINGNWRCESGVDDLDVGDWLNDQLGPSARTLIASANFGSEVQLDAIKVYPISSPSGDAAAAVPYTQGSPITLAYTGTKPSGTGTNQVPSQISCVASLRTSQVGARGRGRIFLPPFPVANLTAGTLTSAAATNLANAVRVFLEGSKIPMPGPGGVQVAPVITGAPFTAYAQINQCRVDTIPDTQRRRRKNLVGTTISVGVDPD